MKRSIIATTLALGLVAGTFSSVTRVAAAAGTCPSSTFCAGAAGADITPPVTTPMWGYTARSGLPVIGQGHQGAEDVGDAITELGAGDVSAFVAGLRTAEGEQLVHDKLNPDPDRYDKTFVSNHGIHLRLFANAFVLQDGNGTKIAVVQTDLGGVPGEMHQAVADRLEAVGVGVDRDHLLIGATHTHQGPGGFFQYQGYALLGGDEFDPRVFDAIATGITNAIVRANTRIEPAMMAWGQIETSRANHNRAVNKQWCEDPENAQNCDANFNELPGHSGWPSRDPLLTVIRLDTVDGLPIGVITNFAAHGTIGDDDNLLFSGDNQGWATRLVERGIAEAYGKPLPEGWEIVDALVNGAQGDQSPDGDNVGYDWGRSVNRQYSEMEDAGRRQMEPAIAEWRALGSALRSDVTLDARFEFLCFCGQKVDPPYLYDGDKIDKTDPLWDHVSAMSALGQGGVTMDDGTASPVLIPTQGYKLVALGGAGTNPSITRMQVLRIGDLAIAGMPGEPTVTVGRRVKAALLALPGSAASYRDVIIAGLANDYDSYFATPEEYTAHQYEGSMTLFGPQESPLLTQELAGLAARMIAGTPVPDCTVPATDPAFCATHPVHPNTSATAVPPTPIDLDPTPATVAQPQRNLSRFEVAEFEWNGGAPSAEWRLDADRVQIQRHDDGTWTTVFGDAHDTATVLRYDKVDGAHRWITQWDIARDIQPGTYRFHVEGGYGAAPGTAAAYTLDSVAFTVSPSGALPVFLQDRGSGTLVISAAHPQPDQQRSFRWRPRLVTTGEVSVTVAGSSEPITVPVDPSGETIVQLQPDDHVESVALHDQFGNHGGL